MHEQIKTATEVGVNFIDMANIYSEGLSEVMIGQAIKNLSIHKDDLVRSGKIKYFGASNISAWQLMKGLAYSQYNMLHSSTGQNTQQNIHHRLIEKAKEVLVTTYLTVSEIAYQLGFEHLQSFSKLFKSKTNLTPIEYRNRYN